MIGDRVRMARKNAGLSQQELRRKSGIQQSKISGIETGKNRKVDVAEAVELAMALNVPMEWLCEYTDRKMTEGRLLVRNEDEERVVDLMRGMTEKHRKEIVSVVEIFGGTYEDKREPETM